MKVLLISPLPPPSGGMTRWTEIYIDAASRAGIQLKVVNSNISKKRAKTKMRSISVIDEMVRTRNILGALSKGIREFGPDLIHICSPCSRFGLFRDYFCTKLAGSIPIIFHCHCNIADQANTKASIFVFKKIIKQCELALVLNSSSKQLVDSLIPGKTVIMPNFIEKEMIVAEHFISDSIKNIIYVGHVKRKKGIEEIYNIATAFPEKIITVIGPIQELPISNKPDNIILMGEVPHERIRILLEASDVFLFPSHTEGFANVMLEAMAAGLPIIATDVGANRDMIEDKGGVITAVGNYKQMIDAMYQLEKKEVRKEMSEWNIAKVRNKYTSNKVIDLIARIYKEILI